MSNFNRKSNINKKYTNTIFFLSNWQKFKNLTTYADKAEKKKKKASVIHGRQQCFEKELSLFSKITLDTAVTFEGSTPS